jgi:cell division protein FtsQ
MFVSLVKTEKTGRESFGEMLRQRRSLFIIAFFLISLVIFFWLCYRYVMENYLVTRIYVDGNTQYSSEKIIEMVTQGPYGNNSLFLSWRYNKERSIDDVPFIEKMDVTILDKNTIRISVYEKALAGYVEYLGNYLYFDREGIVVESSSERMRGIPEVVGLSFDYAVMHEKLPVRNSEIFAVILNIRHLLANYALPADCISFGSKNEITLYFGDVKVALGNEGFIDEKIMELPNILPKLEGLKGVLRMENYDEYALETIFEVE